MELTKLTPGPWTVSEGCGYVTNADDTVIADCGSGEDAEFICLARAAFDVMIRRGWTPFRLASGEWGVTAIEDMRSSDWKCGPYDDPFTALVAADAWYREHCEAKQP